MCAEIGSYADWANVVVNLALVIAAFCAINSWKNQLRWTAQHRLARRVLGRVFRVRDRIRGARSVWLRWPTSEEEFSSSYSARLEPLNRSYRALERELIEAEVLWPGALASQEKDLRRLVQELRLATLHLFEDRIKPEQTSLDRDEREKFRKIVFEHNKPSEPDDFNKRLESIIDRFRNELQRHLGTK